MRAVACGGIHGGRFSRGGAARGEDAVPGGRGRARMASKFRLADRRCRQRAQGSPRRIRAHAAVEPAVEPADEPADDDKIARRKTCACRSLRRHRPASRRLRRARESGGARAHSRSRGAPGAWRATPTTPKSTRKPARPARRKANRRRRLRLRSRSRCRTSHPSGEAPGSAPQRVACMAQPRASPASLKS